jgi:Predicted ATP-dependent endonuclease of the OLD family
MKLIKVRVRDYRSVRDSTEFEIEPDKTILVGPNEAGKTALLRALQSVNPAGGENADLDALRDYPRSGYDDVATGRRDLSKIAVAVATFALEPDDLKALNNIDQGIFAGAKTWVLTRYMNNEVRWSLPEVPSWRTYASIGKDLVRFRAHVAHRPGGDELVSSLGPIVEGVRNSGFLKDETAKQLDAWLERALSIMDEENDNAEAQFDRIRAAVLHHSVRAKAWGVLFPRTPVFVYFSQFFTVRPRIHLAHLAQRQASGEIDENYDFGNLCLLELLGFTAKELSDDANIPAPNMPANQNDHNAMAAYDEQNRRWQQALDRRQYQLNGASVALTKMIRQVWGDEAVTLLFRVDGQYLKVVVQDDLGVEVELDQRSEGFRWLVSFFVVFRAQAKGELRNAILLLDEPGLSLHALKQQEFRKTVSLLAEDNQIIYTTHSPFMVGTDELHLVRLVEMPDRAAGTKVHTSLVVDDPRSVYPLQAALGYELAQSLFGQRRNLVTEGITDMWLIEGVAASMREASVQTLRGGIAIVPAQSASKVIYYCTLLRGQRLKVAALLDSDAAGEKAATQDELVRLLKSKEILRTKDFYSGTTAGPEIEDLLRDTLVLVASSELGWNVASTAASQPSRRIAEIFAAEIGSSFSKYKLAKAFLRWLASHTWADLTEAERDAWIRLTAAINRALT